MISCITRSNSDSDSNSNSNNNNVVEIVFRSDYEKKFENGSGHVFF